MCCRVTWAAENNFSTPNTVLPGKKLDWTFKIDSIIVTDRLKQHLQCHINKYSMVKNHIFWCFYSIFCWFCSIKKDLFCPPTSPKIVGSTHQFTLHTSIWQDQFCCDLSSVFDEFCTTGAIMCKKLNMLINMQYFYFCIEFCVCTVSLWFMNYWT